jgi:hypothetical protein
LKPQSDENVITIPLPPPSVFFALPRCAVAGLTIALLGCTAAARGAGDPPRSGPRLVVVIVIDQFRADYLGRYRDLLVPGGIRLLLEQGANFADCRYRHAVTKTAAGHAVILTGVHADQHGIINNAWVERESLQRVNCVEDATVRPVGRAEPAGGVRPPAALLPKGASPARLLVTTVGDALKLAPALARLIGVPAPPQSQGRLLF